jgi:tol-pal system protein YbgF
MNNRTAAWVGAALLLWSGLAPATQSNKELETRANEMEARLAAIERANQVLVQLQQQVESTRQDLRTLRGQVDELRHELDTLRQQQRDLYGDIDRRLLIVENAVMPSARGPAAAPPPPVDPAAGVVAVPAAGADADELRAADEATVYSDAFAALKAARYDESVRGFQLYLTKYPEGPRADYATYWLGESWYVQKDYANALKAFQGVMSRYPGSRKAPDALLKIAYCQYELKAFRNARVTLQKVVAAYPGTEAARLAEQRLVQMDAEGR